MISTELDEMHSGVNFTQSTTEWIQNEQRLPYGYGHDNPGPQDAMAALNTLKTIVAIWKALKNPEEGVIKKRGKTYD